MAKVVDDFPPHHATKYPWHEWLDGRAWELKQGKDFRVSLEQMRIGAHGAAVRKGLKLRTAANRHDKTLTIQVVDVEA